MSIKAAKKSIIRLYNEILQNLRISKNLSKILPSAFILSKKIEDKELEKWMQLEMSGYFNSNPALTEEVIVPEYRIVPGQYYDIYRRPLIISDPKLRFVNEYRLRHGISELEKLSRSSKLLTIQDPSFLKLIKENLNVEVHSFSFSSTSIIGILDAIKTNLINKLSKITQIVEESAQLENEKEHTTIHLAISNLHPLIQSVASKLFADGHYRQSILDTYILLVETVKTKSGRRDLDGVNLMQTVFSPNNPIIKISDDSDEQLGYMWMFCGAVMGIRNPKAHRLIEQRDPQRTLEWLSYASVLLKVLDEAEVIKY